MNIQISEDAKEKLLSIVKENKGVFQLAYDAEGCGCAVSGVPSLWLIDLPAEHDFENAGKMELPIYYEKRHAVFFEPEMKLTFNKSQNGFKLSSKHQIYHIAMSVTDRRNHRSA